MHEHTYFMINDQWMKMEVKEIGLMGPSVADLEKAKSLNCAWIRKSLYDQIITDGFNRGVIQDIDE